MKLTGKPNVGNPHVGFDEAGTGNGPTRHRASSRPYFGERKGEIPLRHLPDSVDIRCPKK